MEPMSELNQSLTLSEIEPGDGADTSSDYIMETSIDDSHIDLNTTNTSSYTIDLQQDDQRSECDIICDIDVPTTKQSRVRGMQSCMLLACLCI